MGCVVVPPPLLVTQAAFSTLLRDTVLGVAVTRGLLSGMCGAMPSWMLDDLVATVRSLFDSLLPASVTSWVEAVLQDPTFERWEKALSWGGRSFELFDVPVLTERVAMLNRCSRRPL